MTKTALVTGASSGIGACCSQRLVAEGYRVVGTARKRARLETLAAELGDAFLPLELDVDDARAVAALPAALPEGFGEIDVLINNAGHDTGGRQAFAHSDADEMCAVIDTNVAGLIRVTRALIGGMFARGRGHVVNIGSSAGLQPAASMSAYVASKYAVHGFSDSLRLECAGRGVRVSEIMPGLTRTGFAARRLGDAQRAEAFYAGFDAALRPQDVAETVLFALRQPAGVEIAQLLVLPVSDPA